MELRRYKETELNAELDRRKKLREIMPKPLEDADFRKVKALCTVYVETLERNRCIKESGKLKVFTAAMEAVYGKEVWDWINKTL